MIAQHDWSEVKRCFLEALTQPPEQREAFVRERGQKPEVLEWVLDLLKIDATDPALEGPLARHRDDALIGQVLGVYRVVELVARGGMGSVYRAERCDGQFEQVVAIKLLQFDPLQRMMDPTAIERRTLARLKHPNIARILDAGVDPRGESYLVMEFVEGRSLLEHCGSQHCDLDARLDLFEAICAAVNHAHQNLVLHRDLKPDNILVDGQGRPVLLDFGIAGLLDERGDSGGFDFPGMGVQALTPEYASPEQLQGQSLTTASDLYSLGVILFCLLTEERPYDFSQRSRAEILAMMEDRPPRTASEVAEGRIDAPVPAGRLRGDLDRIIAKAISLDPSNRYPSAGELIDDIRRARRGYPVHAHPGGRSYRLHCFVRRNRLALLFATLATTALVIALSMAWHQSEARLEEARKATAVGEFMLNVFDGARPEQRQGEAFTLQHWLIDASARAERELLDQPEVLHRALLKIAAIWSELGDLDAVGRTLERIDAHLALLPEDSIYRIRAQQLHAKVLSDDRRGNARDLEAALTLYTDVVQALKDRPEAQARPLQVQAAIDLARTLNELERPDEALAQLQPALELAKRAPLLDPREILNQIAHAYWLQGEFERALAVQLDIIDQSSQWDGPRFTHQQAAVRSSAATSLIRLGRYEQARDQLLAVAQIYEELQFTQTHEYGGVLHNLAIVAASLNDNKGLMDFARRAVEVFEIASPNSRDYWVTRAFIATALHEQDRFLESINEFEHVVQGLAASMGEDAFPAVFARYQLAQARFDAGQHELALTTLRNVGERVETVVSLTPRRKNDFYHTILAREIQFLVYMEHFEEAIDKAQRLQSLHPEIDESDKLVLAGHFRVAAWAAVALARLGEQDAAQHESDRARKLFALIPASLLADDIERLSVHPIMAWIRLGQADSDQGAAPASAGR